MSTEMTTTFDKPRGTMIVSIPVRFAQRGGRKHIIVPAGSAPWEMRCPAPKNAMVVALAKAYRWRSSLERGDFCSSAELAKAEGANDSYVCRILRLTLLAPDIVEALLDGRQPPTLELKDLLRPFPIEWPKQRDLWGFAKR